MPVIDQFIYFMRNEDFERMVLENDQAPSLFRADGTSVRANETFTMTQLRGFLDEVLHDDRYRALLASGSHFRFQHAHGSGAAAIEVQPADGHLRMTISLNQTSAPSFVAQAEVTDSFLAEHAPAAVPGAQAFHPATAAEHGEPSFPCAAPLSEEPPSAYSTVVHAVTRPQLAVPAGLPRILRLPEARLRVLAAAVGLALGLVTSVAIFLLANKEGMLGHMFNLRSLPATIPVAISCMFFWAAMLCCLRGFRLRAIERISARSQIVDAAKSLNDTKNPEGLFKEIDESKSKAWQASPLLRRLHAVLQQWGIKRSLQDADLILQQHIANDEEAVRAGYNLVRTFVWALPVLGLIGTVIGIALAVGGFAQFLGGNIDDVNVIKQSLVGVTGGLSFAFLITLQGLLTSLLVMLAASALQTREEKLYTAIQQGITDVFLPVLQRVAPEVSPALEASGAPVWRETLQEIAQEVLKKVGDECERLIQVMDTRQQAHGEQVAGWTQAWQREMAAGAGHLEQVFARIGAGQANANRDLLGHLSAVREALTQHALKLQEFSDQQTRAATQQQAAAQTANAEQIRAAQTITAAFAGLSETAQAAVECQTALQSAIRQLGDSRLEQTFAHLGEVLSAQSRELQAMVQAVTGLNAITGQVLKAQAEMQTAVHQLHETGFEQTLAGFRDSLLALKPVLNGFREPFVLQAVPMAGKARGED